MEKIELSASIFLFDLLITFSTDEYVSINKQPLNVFYRNHKGVKILSHLTKLTTNHINNTTTQFI